MKIGPEGEGLGKRSEQNYLVISIPHAITFPENRYPSGSDINERAAFDVNNAVIPLHRKAKSDL
jgi:hypothetical protein